MNDKEGLNYEIFAQFYDETMGDRSENIQLITGLLEEHAPQAKTVLELAVGTGAILIGLSDKYHVAGLDLSPEMLEKARQKVPSAELFEGDMSNFELGKKFDVIICVFDSINHLRAFEQWQSLFSSVSKHLNPKGLFIFDMNTIGVLERHNQEPTGEKDLENGKLHMSVSKTAENVYEWDIEVRKLGPNGGEQAYRDKVIETSFPVNRVQEAALEHFVLLDSFDKTGEPVSDDLYRAYFILQIKED